MTARFELGRRETLLAALLGAAAVATTVPAAAHEQGGQVLGFVAGLLHPISGVDHVLAMVAVGLWGAQLGPPALWILPLTFPMVMALGGMLALLGVPLTGVEYGIGLSALLLGVVVLFEARLPLIAAAALVGLFAVFHGHAHGTELPEGANGALYSIGFVIATGCLHAAGIGIGTLHRFARGRLVLRAAGALIAIGGIYFLVRGIGEGLF